MNMKLLNKLECKLNGHKQPLRQQQFATPEFAVNGKIIKPHTITLKFKEGHGWYFCDRCGERMLR